MHITYLIARYGSGAISNRPHAELIAAWQTMGVSVSVLSLAAGDDPPGTTWLEGTPVQRLPVAGGGIDRALKPLGNLLFHYRYFLTLLPRYALAIPQHRPDLLHVEGAYPHGVLAALAAPQARLALTLQGADVMSEPDYDYGYGRFGGVRRLLRWVFGRAALVRGDSEQIRDLAVRLGCDPARATAIPYNITYAGFPPADSDIAAFRAACRRVIATRHGLDPNAPLVLSLGRLHPFKGVEYLVRATPAILAGQPRARILVAGPGRVTPRFGDYGEHLRRLAADLGVSAAVQLIGAVPHTETQSYFAAADLVVIPSVVEAFNRVLIEAAAVGTPAVVTATTGAADYAARADCALVVAPRSADELATAALRLLGDAALWRRMSDRATDFAQDFRPEQIAARLLALYRPLVT